MKDIVIGFPIILASFLAYFVAQYFGEPVHWFLIIININIGVFSYIILLIIRHQDKDVEETIKKQIK